MNLILQLKQTAIALILFSVCAFSATSAFAGEKEPGWKAGVSQVIITPTKQMWMGGFGFRDKPVQGKTHDLWAKALYLEDRDGNSSLLITADLIGFPKGISDRIRMELNSKLGLSKEQIILNSSHTHSGPELIKDLRSSMPMHSSRFDDVAGKYLDMSKAYGDRLISQLIDLAEKAKKSAKPANLYAGNGVVRFQVNRRNNKEAQIAGISDLNGPNDYAVPVLKIENKRGKVISIVFGYACHPSVQNGYEWSGDYAGFAQLELQKRYKKAVALFFQGAGGDQNALPRRTAGYARQYGEELAAAVDRVLTDEMRQLSPQLKTAYSEIDLKYAKSELTPEKLIQEVLKESSNIAEARKRYAEFTLDLLKKGAVNTESYPYPVQVWRLGDQLLIALGGEVVVGYAVELKKRFGSEIFVMGYANDQMGYIPTVTVLKEGGYEGTRPPVFPLLWDESIEASILGAVTRLVKTLPPAPTANK